MNIHGQPAQILRDYREGLSHLQPKLRVFRAFKQRLATKGGKISGFASFY